MNTPTAPTESPRESSTVANLAALIGQGGRLGQGSELKVGLVKMWFGRVRWQFGKIYGPESEIVALWSFPDSIQSEEKARPLLVKRVSQLEQLFSSISTSGRAALAKPGALCHSIFIGHGRSPVWRELKDFLADRLSLQWDEFNRDSVAGIATTDRLVQMLDNASFAFLVMTAEDEHADATRHARANVVHEVGLFQGRLGMRRAIVLLEEGCHEFSNIHGLSHIPFSCGHVSSAFEKLEGFLSVNTSSEFNPADRSNAPKKTEFYSSSPSAKATR